MSEPTVDGTDVQIAQLENRLRELQEMWSEANTTQKDERGDTHRTVGGDSPRFTPMRPQTPPTRRSPRAYSQRSRESSTAVPMTSSTGVLPSLRSSSGSATGRLPTVTTPPGMSPKSAAGSDGAGSHSQSHRTDAVLLPSLDKLDRAAENTCIGCGQVPPRVGARFCSHCGRRLSQTYPVGA